MFYGERVIGSLIPFTTKAELSEKRHGSENLYSFVIFISAFVFFSIENENKE